MKKKAFTVTLTVLFTTAVQANTVGLYLGGQFWQSEASGILGDKDALANFNLKKEPQINYFVAIEHPFPFLPNVRISSTTLETTGKINLTEEIRYIDDSSLIVHSSLIDTHVNARFNVSYIDYTLYYQLLDNPLFSFYLGLNARDFDGAITVSEATTTVYTWQDTEGTPYTTTHYDESTSRENINEIVPMLYAATNISLPLKRLNVFAQGDYSLLNEHSIYDYQVGLSYKLVDSYQMDLNLTLGYRTVKVEFEDLGSLYSDLDFKGAFVGVNAYF